MGMFQDEMRKNVLFDYVRSLLCNHRHNGPEFPGARGTNRFQMRFEN
jgi:hypothetical protein